MQKFARSEMDMPKRKPSKSKLVCNRALLRKIMESKKDIDFTSLSMSDFFELQFDHPSYQGSGRSLMHRAFGIRTSGAWVLNQLKDYQHFLWYVFEDKMAKGTSKISCPEDVIGLSFGDGKHLKGIDERGLELKRILRRIMEPLLDNEKASLEAFYFEGKRLEEIAEEWGKSSDWVRQVKRRALRKLEMKHSKLLEPFLGIEELSEETA
jgi:hypothetical protein